jgi:hypothetical protein
MTGFVEEPGTAYSSRAHVFIRTPYPRFWMGDRVFAHLFSFLCFPIMYLYVLNSVLSCPFQFGSTLPPVCCWRSHVLYMFVCVQ